MPLKNSKDSKGYYYQWGSRTKYYYNPLSPLSEKIAKNKAIKQAIAISYSEKRRRANL